MRAKKKTIGWLLYKTTLMSLLFVAVISLFVRFTASWFRDVSVTSNGPTSMVIGTIDFDVVTNFDFYNLTLAPDTIYTKDGDSSGQTTGNSMATKIRTSSSHDIVDAFVRIKFITNRTELSLYFDSNRETVASSYPQQSGSSYDTQRNAINNRWYYNSTDDYWYYIGVVQGHGTNLWTTFNDGYKTDNTFTNAKAGEPVEMTFIVEGLQIPYGAYTEVWDTAPAVFNGYAQYLTGYPQS